MPLSEKIRKIDHGPNSGQVLVWIQPVSQAGSYELVTAPTPLELLTKLTNGDVTQANLTIVEG